MIWIPNMTTSRVIEKRVDVNEAVQIPLYFLNPDGSIVNGPLTVTARKDEYGDYTAVSGITAAASGALQGGRDQTADNRWNPAIDGEQGFNAMVTIPQDTLTTVGKYEITVTANTGAIQRIAVFAAA